jgi:hypothetical protein
MKKRRHHYVWRKYLRAWAKNDSIWCLREGKTFNSNIMNVGQIKDFYKLKELSSKDIDFIYKVAIQPSPPHLQELNKNWINSFNLVFSMRKSIESKGINEAEINELLDAAIFNLEEDLHAGIEVEAIKYIDSILKEDIAFFKTEDGCMSFMHYICVQYMRTQKIRTNVIASVGDVSFVDTDKIWNVLSHILATNMAWSLYEDRASFNMVLLKNNTSIELITGDQPIINTHATGMNSTEAPEKLEFYYPISPKLAILITQEHSYGTANKVFLSADEAERYNESIVGQSHSQIYATSKDILNKYAN